MMELFVTCLVSCCTHVFSNTSEWLDMDKQALQSAQVACAKYYENSPCLTKFTRTEPQTYQAICGKNNNRAPASDQTLFQNNCVRCHGEKGLGDGPDSKYYIPRPRNLAKDSFILGDSENQIANTIKYGFNQMPSFYYLTDDQRHAISKYVRSLRNE